MRFRIVRDHSRKMRARVEGFSTCVRRMSSGDAANKYSTCLSINVVFLRLGIKTIPAAIFVCIALEASLKSRKNRFEHGIKY